MKRWRKRERSKGTSKAIELIQERLSTQSPRKFANNQRVVDDT
jgi:hypothetical protein